MTGTENSKPNIGFIGMGHMGSHMASRLLDAGYQVTVYDRTHEKAQEVGQRGAHVAQTPKELAVNCQIVAQGEATDRLRKGRGPYQARNSASGKERWLRDGTR